MKIYLAADHAGFELKGRLRAWLAENGHDAVDCGAESFDIRDDYPVFVASAARLLSADVAQGKGSRAIVIGASGQGEAMVANRFPGVRCALYYGQPQRVQTDAAGKELEMIASTRIHNDANCLSLGARFLSEDDAKTAVRLWLESAFGNEERHVRRIAMIESETHA